ncbi:MULTISPECIES: hypothetical protein [unclassified Mucilaginibacter]|uniref:hypothetical protein n=1 Tax=unclassified Mucilaginibacter TaxID=2617802 RepID=UPI000966C889|nr:MULTISPECIES: hypothetical protein [unclassified Mucilaginibacter]OJW18551.1 MAG: hypothetical protein BGO48_18655 [Mucilaginibacter sp. 44-25]PLW89202.1 MAG: hypothetical protein C0154_12940 [Mucilaginibacter sp.]PMP65005.1 MAG: hypothetical protein C0191_04920 [Mucilaginibacter sp.]HEK20697.1 hypothetical protein [Bacteroidota bacterium]
MSNNKFFKIFSSAAIAILFSLTVQSAFAQKWLTGYFIDVKGNKTEGFIYPNPGGKGPIKGEGFINFKESEKAEPYSLSTSDLQSFVAGKDSFVVAHAPGNETWNKQEFDFVRVALNEEIKIFATRGAGSGGGKKIHVSPGVGIGAGSYGAAYGGGLGISFGDGNGGNSNKLSYYYGGNTATMQHLTDANFRDIMSEAMGDEPEVVAQIQAGKYNLRSIEKLIQYFNKVKAADKR